jgi:two-component system probable response regulator PhcQ
MQDLYDYRKFAVLYVDDEEKSLKLFSRAFGETFRIFTAANAKDGLQLLENHRDEIGLLMSDQRMPGEKGVWLLERARQLQPRLLRILVTAYTDMQAAIDAVNTGAIYKYVTKPWEPVQLEHTLKRGLEFFIVQHERDQLLKERISVLQRMMVADRIVSLGLLSAGLSHHIRNALVAVKTFLDLAPAKMQEERLAAEGLQNPEFWKEYHQNVQGQIHKINSLLHELGSATGDPSCKFGDEVALRQVVTEVIGGMQQDLAAKKLTVTNSIPETLPTLKVDKPTFTRLFQLLLKDEMVSLPEGTAVTVSAKVGPGSTLTPSEIEIEVQDNGPGLPPEAVPHLFNPFVVRSESPAEYGINLMTCYFIVSHHGGRIEARSEPGHGTTFTIRLPTDPTLIRTEESPDFLQKLSLNEALWKKLASE